MCRCRPSSPLIRLGPTPRAPRGPRGALGEAVEGPRPPPGPPTPGRISTNMAATGGAELTDKGRSGAAPWRPPQPSWSAAVPELCCTGLVYSVWYRQPLLNRTSRYYSKVQNFQVLLNLTRLEKYYIARC